MADDHDRMPWFRFFGRDYLGDPDIQELSLEEQGALVRLWASYCATGRALPGDLQRASRMTQVPVPLLELLLPRHFEQDESGDWFSPRMDREHGRDATRSEKAQKAARARWEGERKRVSREQRGKAESPDDPDGGCSKHDPRECSEHASSTCSEDARSTGRAHAKPVPQNQNQSQSTEPVPDPTPSHPSSHPTRTADVRPPTVEDGWLAGREVVPSEEDPPPESAASAASGRIINLARRRAGPSRPVPIGRAVGDVVAGIARLQAGGAS